MLYGDYNQMGTLSQVQQENSENETIIDAFIEVGNAYAREHWQERNKDKNLGARWTREQRIDNCGMIVGLRRGTDQKMHPIKQYCHLPDCPECGPRLARVDRNRIGKQLDLARAKNPNLKLRILDDVPAEKEDALQKRIKRNGGSYTRKVNANGTRLYIIQIENVYSSPEKMRHVFGREIQPRTVVREDDNIRETYQRRLDDIIGFEDTRMEHAENGSYWSGSLHEELSEEQTTEYKELVKSPKAQPQGEKCKLRYTVYIGKTMIDTERMDEHDTWSDKIVGSMDELQVAMDELAARDIEYFTAQGINFEPKTAYRYVKADEWEKWNETAKEKCPNLCIPLENIAQIRTFERDSDFEQLAMSFAGQHTASVASQDATYA